MNFSEDDDDSEDSLLPVLKTPPAEQLAINACAGIDFTNGLFRTLGRGQCGISQAQRVPAAKVTVHLHEMYAAEETQILANENQVEINVVCSADLPDETIDLFVLPISRGGDQELARDYLQQGYHSLTQDGTLIVSIDNPKDSWLHHEVEKLGKHLSRHTKKTGMVYKLVKQKPLKRERDFSHHFAFRDNQTLIQMVARPGVYSHRKLDLSARALLEGMVINANEQVLDIGCGAGVIAMAAALRAQNVKVHAIDSNARAIDSCLQSATLNAITSLTTTLTCQGELPQEGVFDVALGNPPYHSNYQIAELFLQTARRGLKSGGRVYIVSTQSDWLVARMGQIFSNVKLENHRGFAVVRGVKS